MFKSILVPLDGSALAEQALGVAAAIARESKATIDLVTVFETVPFAGFDDAPWNRGEWGARQTYVQSTAAELAAGASVAVTGTIVRGEPAEQLCDRGHSIGADLIVLTSHGRTGISRAWLGSVADSLVRRSDLPVLVLPSDEREKPGARSHRALRHMLVPLDGSSLAADIIPSAVALASASGASVTLLRIIAPVPMVAAIDPAMPFGYAPSLPDQSATDSVVAEAREEIGRIASQLHDESKLVVDTEVIASDRTAQAIVDYARAHHVDVIAMATRGRGASRVLLGSVADKVLRSCGLPVLLHRPVVVGEEVPLLTERAVSEQLPALGIA